MINVIAELNLTDDCFDWLNEERNLNGYNNIDSIIEDILELTCQKEYFSEED